MEAKSHQFETSFFPRRFRFGKLAYFRNLILTHPLLLLFHWKEVKHGSTESLPFLSCILADLGFEHRALTSLPWVENSVTAVEHFY